MKMYAQTPSEIKRSAMCAAGHIGPDLMVPGMSYTMAEVNKAERRIRDRCPTALINRTNYGFSLVVAKSDKSIAFTVFDDRDGRPIVIGDVDRIIAALSTS